jgi:hypothetical protein
MTVNSLQQQVDKGKISTTMLHWNDRYYGNYDGSSFYTCMVAGAIWDTGFNYHLWDMNKVRKRIERQRMSEIERRKPIRVNLKCSVSLTRAKEISKLMKNNRIEYDTCQPVNYTLNDIEKKYGI